MQAENKHLTPEQARYLTVHGASQNEDGTYSWKFDNYARSFSPVDFSAAEMQALWGNISCPILLVNGKVRWASEPDPARPSWPSSRTPARWPSKQPDTGCTTTGWTLSWPRSRAFLWRLGFVAGLGLVVVAGLSQADDVAAELGDPVLALADDAVDAPARGAAAQDHRIEVGSLPLNERTQVAMPSRPQGHRGHQANGNQGARSRRSGRPRRSCRPSARRSGARRRCRAWPSPASYQSVVTGNAPVALIRRRLVQQRHKALGERLRARRALGAASAAKAVNSTLTIAATPAIRVGRRGMSVPPRLQASLYRGETAAPATLTKYVMTYVSCYAYPPAMDDFVESLRERAFFAHRLRRLSEALVDDCGAWFRRGSA